MIYSRREAQRVALRGCLFSNLMSDMETKNESRELRHFTQIRFVRDGYERTDGLFELRY